MTLLERFESKHLPVEVQIGGRSENSVPKHNSPSHIQKLIWDDNKRSDFENKVRKEQFVAEINRATISLRLSVDEAVKRLSECLLTAAHCMVRTTKEQIKIHNLQKKIQDIDKEQKAKLQN